MRRFSLLARVAAQWNLCALVTASPPPIFTTIAHFVRAARVSETGLGVRNGKWAFLAENTITSHLALALFEVVLSNCAGECESSADLGVCKPSVFKLGSGLLDIRIKIVSNPFTGVCSLSISSALASVGGAYRVVFELGRAPGFTIPLTVKRAKFGGTLVFECLPYGQPFPPGFISDVKQPAITSERIHRTPTFNQRRFYFHSFDNEANDPIEQFLLFLMKHGSKKAHTVCIAHNGGKYDFHLVLEALHRRSIPPKRLCTTGLKIYSMKLRGLNQRRTKS
ncbi:hypothetical protein niasHS_009296 [Heterodera schachtii]|uniref:DNA-directed DNA polymerase n=2 Tax=Heterodera TaxID=34509 RepID=A0ABD2JBS1_HETSC